MGPRCPGILGSTLSEIVIETLAPYRSFHKNLLEALKSSLLQDDYYFGYQFTQPTNQGRS